MKKMKFWAPCSSCMLRTPSPHAQARIKGAVEVPLFVVDDDMSPAGLLKQVGPVQVLEP